VVAIPGALVQFRRQGRFGGRLVRFLVLGTVPGVIAGAVIRVELLAGRESFYIVMAAMLVPLGAWLGFGRRLTQPQRTSEGRDRRIILLALVVGTIGGIYGVGGGSILAPILVGLGYAVVEVAPAALVATFLTSIAGVATYGILSLGNEGDIAPDWLVGFAMGGGGLIGGTLGARLQPRLPEALLRRSLGVLALGLGVRYAVLGLA
jgi:uncharacterized protein